MKSTILTTDNGQSDSSTLTPIPNNNFPTNPFRPSDFTITPNGKFGFSIQNTVPPNQYTKAKEHLVIYSINQLSGELKSIETLNFSENLTTFLIDSDGQFLYLLCKEAIKIFSITKDGKLNEVKEAAIEMPIHNSYKQLLLTLDGKYLLAFHTPRRIKVSDTSINHFKVFSINQKNTIKLKEVNGSPFKVGTNGTFASFSNEGNFLFISSNGKISSFLFNPLSGTIGKEINSVKTNTQNPSNIIVNNNYMYVNEIPGLLTYPFTAQNGISIFTFNKISGIISKKKNNFFPTERVPNALAINSGIYLYAVGDYNIGGNGGPNPGKHIWVYNINSNKDSLVKISEQGISGFTYPTKISISNNSRYVYVNNSGTLKTNFNTVSQAGITTYESNLPLLIGGYNVVKDSLILSSTISEYSEVEIISSGFCYSNLNVNPDTSNTIILSKVKTDTSFNTDIITKDIKFDTIYYARPYVHLQNKAIIYGNTFTFTFNSNKPTITSLDPTVIMIKQELTIHGTNFSLNPKENYLIMGNGAVIDIITSTETLVKAKIRRHSLSGPVHLNVNGTPSNLLKLIVKARPIILGFSPSTIETGGTLTINGLDYSKYNEILVTFDDGATAKAVYVNRKTLTVIIPDDAKTGNTAKIMLSTNGESRDSLDDLTIKKPVTFIKLYNSGSLNLTGVVWGDKQFVAIGHNGTNATSTDGFEWTKGTQLPIPENQTKVPYLHTITYGDGRYVAADTANDLISYSNDGVTWKTAYTGKQEWIDLVWGNDTFVAVGLISGEGGAETDTYYSATSSDGINWNVHKININLSSVILGKDQFVAYGSNTLALSTDGITWTEPEKQHHATSIIWCEGLQLYISINSYGSSTSSDGINWEMYKISSRLFRYMNGLACIGTQLVAIGPIGAMTSTDGIHWTDFYSNINSVPSMSFAEFSIAIGNDVFVTPTNQGIACLTAHRP